MKKQIILIGIICGIFAIHEISAQRFAIQGGVDWTNIISNDDVNLLSKRTGYHAGGYLEIPLKNRAMNINVGLNFSLKGAETYEDSNDFINMYYIEVPVTFSYRINIVRNYLSILPTAGFYGDILLDAKTMDMNLYKEFKPIDIGVKAGGTLEIMKKMQFAFEYYRGFIKLSNGQSVFYEYGNNEGMRGSFRMFF